MQLTSMLITTPLTVDDAFANAKKSESCMNFPSFLALGFRNKVKFENGLEIAAATKEE